MGRYTVHRKDNGSDALIAHAKALGFQYHSIGGALDGLLAWGTTVTAIDWKSAGGTLTPSQQKLIASGFPVRFISTPQQLEQLRDEIMSSHRSAGTR